MNQSYVTIAVFVLGALGNLLWTLINLRVAKTVADKIDDLKTWMDGRYYLAEVAEIRDMDVDRRLSWLEKQRERHA